MSETYDLLGFKISFLELRNLLKSRWGKRDMGELSKRMVMRTDRETLGWFVEAYARWVAEKFGSLELLETPDAKGFHFYLFNPPIILEIVADVTERKVILDNEVEIFNYTGIEDRPAQWLPFAAPPTEAELNAGRTKDGFACGRAERIE